MLSLAEARLGCCLPRGSEEVGHLTTQTQIAELCRVALEEESGWRDAGVDGRKAAYARFQQLLHTIADLTGRSYEDVLNDAVEEWIRDHFCLVGDGAPSAEWSEAGRIESSAHR
jgi:hypothetical protein